MGCGVDAGSSVFKGRTRKREAEEREFVQAAMRVEKGVKVKARVLSRRSQSGKRERESQTPKKEAQQDTRVLP